MTLKAGRGFCFSRSVVLFCTTAQRFHQQNRGPAVATCSFLGGGCCSLQFRKQSFGVESSSIALDTTQLIPDSLLIRLYQRNGERPCVCSHAQVLPHWTVTRHDRRRHASSACFTWALPQHCLSTNALKRDVIVIESESRPHYKDGVLVYAIFWIYVCCFDTMVTASLRYMALSLFGASATGTLWGGFTEKPSPV